jgi:hypothetical protein
VARMCLNRSFLNDFLRLGDLFSLGVAFELFTQQLEWIEELRGRDAIRPEDIERSGRICDEPFGESEDGQTPADAASYIIALV